jgi:diacylglycerol kinase
VQEIKKGSPLKFALQGLASAFRKETHIKVHFTATLFVVAAAFYFRVSARDWIVLLSCCVLVIIIELVNTAIEEICNLINPNFNSRVKFIKDIMAGAVLIAVIFSVVTGVIVFLQYI